MNENRNLEGGQAMASVDVVDAAIKTETSPKNVLSTYLHARSEELQLLSELRRKGWESSAGDEHYRKKREHADSQKDKRYMYKMMQEIGDDIHEHRKNALKLPSSCSELGILDFCMAPGGLLKVALKKNPTGRAVAFSLAASAEQGGHAVLLEEHFMSRVFLRYLDITMLAEDMGVRLSDIPSSHDDHGDFLSRQLFESQYFGLVICDGQVLRTHRRSDYREPREATRLTVTQLAIGLEHLSSGGTMIVYLHRLESWESAHCLWTFSRFSQVSVYKHKKHHANGSAFYLLARDVQTQSLECQRAIQGWKHVWSVATFGSDQEYAAAKTYQDTLWADGGDIENMLENFGEKLIELGGPIWRIQREALANMKFMKET